MPYEKLYIRSKRQGAAARGSLFLRVGEADAGNIVQNSTEENSRLHIHFPGDRIESSEIRKELRLQHGKKYSIGLKSWDMNRI